MELSTVEKIFDLEKPLFSRDFIVVDLFPSLVLTGSITGLLMAGAPGNSPNGGDFTRALANTTGPSIAVFLAVSVVVAVVTHPFRPWIRRLLTGRSPKRVTFGLRRHQLTSSRDRFATANRAAKVTDPSQDSPALREAAEDLKRRHARPAHLTPTRLGNAYEALRKLVPESEDTDVLLGAAEPKAYRDARKRAAQRRDPMLQAIDDVGLQVAAAERYTFVWPAVALAFMWLLIEHKWWLLLPTIALALSYLAYLGAVESVVQFNYLAERLIENKSEGDPPSDAPQGKARPERRV